MPFARVQTSKFENMHFSSYFDIFEEVVLTLSPTLMKPYRKNLFKNIPHWIRLYRVRYFSFEKEFVFVTPYASKCF